jgi:hypothetical protein
VNRSPLTVFLMIFLQTAISVHAYTSLGFPISLNQVVALGNSAIESHSQSFSVNGESVLNGSGDGWDFDADTSVLTIAGSESYTVTGLSETIRIVIPAGVTNQMILQNVHIDQSARLQTPLSVGAGSDVDMILSGQIILKGGMGRAGLHVSAGASLRLSTQGSGTLQAIGWFGAGIGGDLGESTGSIHISSNVVIAASAIAGGAGIGGGPGGHGGQVTISGGTVTATGGP